MLPTLAPPATEATEFAIAAWINRSALATDDLPALLRGFCERLVDAGVPLLRVGVAANVVHPIIEGRGYNWRRGVAEVEVAELTREMAAQRGNGWNRSPFYHLPRDGSGEIRRTLGSTYRRGEFGLLDDFVAQGCTDYLAFIVPLAAGSILGSRAGVLFSVQTDRPGGFAEAELDLVRRLALPFAHACKTIMALAAGSAVVATYLGRDPARQVMEGRIEQGRAEPVQAVLWSSDLMGFTRVADTLPRDQLLEFLNSYADCIVGIIGAHGGEVLKFIGDGIIAIFPLAGPEGGAACARALDAAEATLRAVQALGERRAAAGLARTGIHLALHRGEVLYGNIGSRERLDFTVVGPAVNEVARIEAMCRSLDQRLVISAAFAAEATPKARTRLVSLGRYALRGVSRPQELFTLDMQAAAPEPRRGGEAKPGPPVG